jgi:citrate lyase beta subunit
MRSLLYVPGNSEKMIVKARDTAADGLILDLEDAVAPEHKREARATVVRLLSEMNFGGKEVFVRINALTTDYGMEDARAAASSKAHGILIPKVENVDAVTTVASILHQRASKILCLIETPRGVFAARAIAECSERVAGLLFGSADLSREIGAQLTADETELLYARQHVLLAARAANVAAYDSPHFVIADLDGVRRRATAARQMGYDGKTVIHPSHLEIVNEVFAPSSKQIAQAERVVAAMAAAQAAGRGAVALDGQLIDQLHLTAANRLLKQIHRQTKET